MFLDLEIIQSGYYGTTRLIVAVSNATGADGKAMPLTIPSMIIPSMIPLMLKQFQLSNTKFMIPFFCRLVAHSELPGEQKCQHWLNNYYMDRKINQSGLLQAFKKQAIDFYTITHLPMFWTHLLRTLLNKRLIKSFNRTISSRMISYIRPEGFLGGARAVPPLANVGVGVTIQTRAQQKWSGSGPNKNGRVWDPWIGYNINPTGGILHVTIQHSQL
uniref:Uncharacterized protein n=1 Tax=Romanomermis culicivorax TaxID=13658 RepID=A0A915IB53_ROMCU